MQRYSIQSVLATTHTGNVVLCIDTESGAHVAIKRVDTTTAGDRTATVDDIAFETRVHTHVLADGGHPNLLTVCAAPFVDAGVHHLVLPYCANGELYDAVFASPTGTLDHDVARRYVREIAAAVLVLHTAGFAHRDLSLENVLLDDNHSCRVIDFGLAASTSSKRTEVVGKPFYMAPEVVAGLPYDAAKADVWSLGIMLFIMLSGTPLFDSAAASDDRFEYLADQGLASLVESWEIADCFDPQSLSLLENMLQIDPTKRLTMAEVHQHPFVLDETRTHANEEPNDVATKKTGKDKRQPALEC
ncbi:Aste57867_11786 [Aphanomyces stellatus]|uniref:Aste57867_11786 protein n=1 Tax=Aphanomyces stellatus TaxID=120398 RepID=A0A485KV32_9STRA|nr:hypothetical protein As57867_011741 [Aphanomyces stellatus]VFT88642.1 Aste57867_11786 [Aphanomyces stellatus]